MSSPSGSISPTLGDTPTDLATLNERLSNLELNSLIHRESSPTFIAHPALLYCSIMYCYNILPCSIYRALHNVLLCPALYYIYRAALLYCSIMYSLDSRPH